MIAFLIRKPGHGLVYLEVLLDGDADIADCRDGPVTRALTRDRTSTGSRSLHQPPRLERAQHREHRDAIGARADALGAGVIVIALKAAVNCSWLGSSIANM